MSAEESRLCPYCEDTHRDVEHCPFKAIAAANDAVEEHARATYRALHDDAPPAPAPGVPVLIDADQHAALVALVAEAEGIIPVSVESMVGMAVDAFLDGAVERGAEG